MASSNFLPVASAPAETIALLLRSESSRQDRSSGSFVWNRHSRRVTCGGSPTRTPAAEHLCGCQSASAPAAGSAPKSASHTFAIYISTSTWTETPGSLRSGRPMLFRRRPRSSPLRPEISGALARRRLRLRRRRNMTLKLLAMAFGGDPACTDCNRVLRIPGFHNRKYDARTSCHRRIPLRFDPIILRTSV